MRCVASRRSRDGGGRWRRSRRPVVDRRGRDRGLVLLRDRSAGDDRHRQGRRAGRARPGSDLHDGRRRRVAAADACTSTPSISIDSRSRRRASPSFSKHRRGQRAGRVGRSQVGRGRASCRSSASTGARPTRTVAGPASACRRKRNGNAPRAARTRGSIPGATTRLPRRVARFATSASGAYQGGLAPVGSHAEGQSGEGSPGSRRERQRVGGRLVLAKLRERRRAKPQGPRERAGQGHSRRRVAGTGRAAQIGEALLCRAGQPCRRSRLSLRTRCGEVTIRRIASATSGCRVRRARRCVS